MSGWDLGSTHQKLALGLTTTALAIGSKILPEERVVDVAATVEVEQRGLSGGSLGIALGPRITQSFNGGIVASHVGLVVLGVVEFHDLTGNMRLEGSVVIYLVQAVSGAWASFGADGSHWLRLGKRRDFPLTRKVRQRSLAAGEAGAGHGGHGLGGAEASPDDGRGAKQSR